LIEHHGFLRLQTTVLRILLTATPRPSLSSTLPRSAAFMKGSPSAKSTPELHLAAWWPLHHSNTWTPSQKYAKGVGWAARPVQSSIKFSRNCNQVVPPAATGAPGWMHSTHSRRKAHLRCPRAHLRIAPQAANRL
jgi:hypothetical protein